MADTHPGDGNAEVLHRYWVHGKGAALVRWGEPNDFERCTRLLEEHAHFTPEQAKGYCNLAHKAALGIYPATHAKEEKGHRSMNTTFTRSYPLEDITIRSGGDGRTVDAYAAIFDTPSEIRDQDGHYNEIITRTAFDKTIAERGTKFGVLYNHGLTVHGTPSDRGSMPIGTPLEVRADSRGVFTRTRYNATPLADEVLEGIRAGSITAQSFAGRFVQSNPSRVPRRTRGGDLPTVTRTEVMMREYGPTPFPAYEDASIVGVRALLGDLADDIDFDELRALVARAADLNELRDLIEDRGDERSTTPSGPESGETTTPADAGAGTDGPTDGHPGPVLTRAQARARLLKNGILL